MTWSAPTPRELVQLRADLCVGCETCRVLRAPIRLAEDLAAGRWADTPIDKLIFRCHVCGAPGRPLAHAPGNLLVGRAQLWPPAEADAEP